MKSILKPTTSNDEETLLQTSRQTARKSSRVDSARTPRLTDTEKKGKKSGTLKATKSTAVKVGQWNFARDEDDQTEAFLKGFESDDNKVAANTDGGLASGEDVPKIPNLSKKEQKRKKRLAEAGESEKPGVIYIGRIPHGFYEQEMRAYFEQFGKILRLRLSRNRQTGASKHHAWIEFESATVADIVAKTMNNYLLFNHILKVQVVPDEQVPVALFKGANRTFKKIPWNKIQGRKLKQPVTEEGWEKRVAKEQQKREKKAEKLKQLGYEFDAPSLKSAAGLAQKAEAPLLLTFEEGEDATKAVDTSEEVVEEVGEHSNESNSSANTEPGFLAMSISAETEHKVTHTKKEEKIEVQDVEAKQLKKHTEIVVSETEVISTTGALSKTTKKETVETIG